MEAGGQTLLSLCMSPRPAPRGCAGSGSSSIGSCQGPPCPGRLRAPSPHQTRQAQAQAKENLGVRRLASCTRGPAGATPAGQRGGRRSSRCSWRSCSAERTLCWTLRENQARRASAPSLHAPAPLPWSQAPGGDTRWAQGTASVERGVLPGLLRHCAELDLPRSRDRLLAGTQPSLPEVRFLTYLRGAWAGQWLQPVCPAWHGGGSALWASYQRPSSPSWTTSTTSPLLTASVLGLPFSSSTTTVYFPGTCGGRHAKPSASAPGAEP